MEYTTFTLALYCDRCENPMGSWFPDGPGRRICRDCRDYREVLKAARALYRSQQLELIAELEKGD